jgi:hypothetical protein
MASVIIETPVGEDIFVDDKKVGTVGAPVSATGKIKITTVPAGARIYTKRLANYVYSGLSPQTLTVPASSVPILVKITKAEFSDVHDIVYIVPNETVSRRYAMERVAIEEPEEATTALKVMSHPAAEVFLYMEGAEGFISYGRTPQTLTLKARTGAWVPMSEAKRALAETRLSQIEQGRVLNEDDRRTRMVYAAQDAYDSAKAERESVEMTLRGFRDSYNMFQVSFNTGYDSFTDAERAKWDMDNLYWVNILLDYESRRQQLRGYEDQMKNELAEAKLRSRSPFWLPTPGMKGVMWHLKLEEKGHRTVVDEFLLEPGVPTTKDYALVKPDSPFAFAWLYIISWPEKTVGIVKDNTSNRVICYSGSYQCSYKFIKVKPGRRSYTFSGHVSYMHPVSMTLNIAPGETRYVQLDGVTPTEAEKRAMGDWLACP